MTLCNWCSVVITNQSYFIRDGEGMDAQLIEVCPECHHHKVYGPKDLLEKYKEWKGIQ